MKINSLVLLFLGLIIINAKVLAGDVYDFKFEVINNLDAPIYDVTVFEGNVISGGWQENGKLTIPKLPINWCNVSGHQCGQGELQGSVHYARVWNISMSPENGSVTVPAWEGYSYVSNELWAVHFTYKSKRYKSKSYGYRKSCLISKKDAELGETQVYIETDDDKVVYDTAAKYPPERLRIRIHPPRSDDCTADIEPL